MKSILFTPVMKDGKQVERKVKRGEYYADIFGNVCKWVRSDKSYAKHPIYTRTATNTKSPDEVREMRETLIQARVSGSEKKVSKKEIELLNWVLGEEK
jgi:hypothetical protein